MPNPYPIKIQAGDDEGPVTIQGEATFTDPSNQPSTQTTGTEVLEGNPVDINNGQNADLTFDTKDSGDTLLDITAPAAPTFINAGVYAVHVAIEPGDPMTAGGSYAVVLSRNGAAVVVATSPGATAGTPNPNVTVVMVVAVNASDSLTCNVANADGVSDIHFQVGLCTVTRIS